MFAPGVLGAFALPRGQELCSLDRALEALAEVSDQDLDPGAKLVGMRCFGAKFAAWNL